jgi:protein tyrosine/serine phosphatase
MIALRLAIMVISFTMLVTVRSVAGINVAYPPLRNQLEQETNLLRNFHWVSPNLARGAQPSGLALAELDRLGFKTIVNLRGFHADPSSKATHQRIPFMTWHAEDEDVVQFLKVANDPSKGPVFVHCMHGSDRTGMMIAMYRMTVQGWNRNSAILEIKNGGFGFHPQWTNLVRYLNRVDVEKIKKQAGIL